MSQISEALRKHWHLITVLVGTVIVFLIIYLLRNALLPFLLGMVLVYLLVPIVSWVERRFSRKTMWILWLEGKRISSILIVNFAIVVIFGLFAFYVFNTVARAFTTLLQDAPDHWLAAMSTIEQWTEAFRKMLPPGVRDRVDLFAIDAGTGIATALSAGLKERVAQIPSTLGSLLGLAAMPLFVFYLLKDREKLSNSFFAALPAWAAEHIRNIFLIVENVLGRYIRAELTLGAVVGLLNLAGFLIIRAPLAPLLAAVAGVGEMIPSFGPIVAAAVAAIVMLALAPAKVFLVILVAGIVQLLENNFLVPRIQGGYLGLHPAATIVLLVIGAALAGLWGMLLAAPLAATAIQLYRYVHKAVQDKQPPTDLGDWA